MPKVIKLVNCYATFYPVIELLRPGKGFLFLVECARLLCPVALQRN